jgi:hypothetical protein
VNHQIFLTSANGERYTVTLQPNNGTSGSAMNETYYVANDQSEEVAAIDGEPDQDVAAMHVCYESLLHKIMLAKFRLIAITVFAIHCINV